MFFFEKKNQKLLSIKKNNPADHPAVIASEAKQSSSSFQTHPQSEIELTRI
jgi:hypothetical protein